MSKHHTHKGPQSPPRERLREVHTSAIVRAIREHETANRRVHFCMVLLFLIFITVVAF